KPGSAFRTLSPHCWAVIEVMDQPYAFPPVHAPAGTPASDEPAANTSGYEASNACVMHAPDDAPTENTRLASALYIVTTYWTIFTMLARSPLRPSPASKQLPPAPGAMMMKPRVSAMLWNQECA